MSSARPPCKTRVQVREYGEFVGPKQAVDLLNDPARPGRGEATVTPRKNGTVGLLYLSPGSLGDSTIHTWYYKEFPAPYGVRNALAFLNAHPRHSSPTTGRSRAMEM